MIRAEKQILRERMKSILAGLSGQKSEASARLRAHLARVEAWRCARVVYGFAPMDSEPDWLGPEDPPDKTLAFPKTHGRAMTFFAGGQLVPGRFGVREPSGGIPAPPPDLILVPGLAFDRSGNRLGWGGGFYDRWLAEHPDGFRLGVCFSRQIIDRIPGEPHDLRVDAVLTEDGLTA